MSTTIKCTRNERSLTVKSSLVDATDVHLTIEDPTRPNKVLVICVSRSELYAALEAEVSL